MSDFVFEIEEEEEMSEGEEAAWRAFHSEVADWRQKVLDLLSCPHQPDAYGGNEYRAAKEALRAKAGLNAAELEAWRIEQRAKERAKKEAWP